MLGIGPSTLGGVEVLWDNIGGVDLTESATQNAIGIEIVFDDLPADIVVTITDGSSNTGQATSSAPGGIFSPTSVVLTFASFSGSIDFTDVESISLGLSATFPATDVQIGFIESTSVPEPSTALLLTLGLVGLAARRQKGSATGC